MPFPAANYTVTIRGRRGNKNYFARDIEVFIFPADVMAVVDPNVAPKFKHAIHWDPDDTIDDGTPDGDVIRESDLLINWSRFPNQEFALSSIREDLAGEGGFALMTAYFAPSDMGGGDTAR